MPAMSNKAKEQFIEQTGLRAKADGLPRIAGRMMGFFVIHGGTHSFSELAERLQVSRGSISTNARLLEGLGILEKRAKPGDRQDYFRLSEDPYGRLLKGYLQRMESSRHMVSQTINELPTKDASMKRLQDMQRFYEITLDSTQAGLDTWSETRK